MSSVPGNNIVNTADLDTEFPVPGQDNDSQGFRDNFTVINNNATSIKARLEDLEANVVRIDSTGTGTYANTNIFEDLSGGGTARLVKPTLQSQREVVDAVGNSSGVTTIDFDDGNYHTITLTGDTTIAFTNAPDSGYYGRFILHITASAGPHNLEFSDSLTLRVETGSASFFDGTTAIGTGEVHLVEIHTYAGTTEYFGRYIGQYS
jgi:hypothetical protein